MGSQKLGAYEVRYKWKILKVVPSVNDLESIGESIVMVENGFVR